MSKFSVTVRFPANESREIVELEGMELHADNVEDASEELVAYIADNIEVAGAGLSSAEVEVTYSIQGTATFWLGDDGQGEDLSDYLDEDTLRSGIETGDFESQVTDAITESLRQNAGEWEIEEISVDATS